MNARVPLIGLLLVQLAVAYEWTMSGLTKIVRGGFPTGLAGELRDKSQGAAGWYRSFLDNAVIPHGSVWGYTIEFGEVLIGVALLAGALVWLFRYEQLSARGRGYLFLTIAAASLGAVVMAVNFHLANGAPHPWLIPKDGFDEGVDLDSLLPVIQLITAGVSLRLWQTERRTSKSKTPVTVPPAAAPLAR